jgi:hypothetical protein
MLSYIGAFEVFEEDTETTRSNFIRAVLCFLSTIPFALGVSAYLNQWKICVKSIIGGIAGICLGFKIYSLIVAIFIKSLFILILMLTFCFIVGIMLMFFEKIENKETRATVLIGAYLVVRGLSLFIGEYPNEAQNFD